MHSHSCRHIDIRRFEFCEEMSKLLKDGSRRGYSEKVPSVILTVDSVCIVLSCSVAA